MGDVAQAATALFVPGHRPDRFAKAAGAGADLVVIDLEDAVPPEAKDAARTAVVEALTPGAGGVVSDPVQAVVRVNPAGTSLYEADLAGLARLSGVPGHGLLGVMLPKAEDPDPLRRLVDLLGGAVVPLVESARGVLRSVELAAVPGVTRLAFGALDFALDVGADDGSATLTHARAQLVLASRAAGIAPPLDSPSTEVTDAAVVTQAARAARAMGFGGKLCIHPAQLEPVRTAFRPTADEVDWARRVVGAGDAAVQIDGRMVDRPLVERARRILASAG